VDVAATGYTADDWLDNSKPTGAVASDAVTLTANQLMNRTGITSVSLPNATSIPEGFCKGCTGLSSVFAPKVTTLGSSAFSDCQALTAPVFMPLASVGSSSFAGCTHLQCAVVGSFGAYASYSMTSNTALAAVDVIGGNSMGGAKTFSGNNALKTLILRASSVCALSNLNIIEHTPFASGKSGGTLYVPSSLISAYQSATNWSTVLGYPNNLIEAIEGSVYETQYADGTPIA
jgi:hypothetical protein